MEKRCPGLLVHFYDQQTGKTRFKYRVELFFSRHLSDIFCGFLPVFFALSYFFLAGLFKDDIWAIFVSVFLTAVLGILGARVVKNWLSEPPCVMEPQLEYKRIRDPKKN